MSAWLAEYRTLYSHGAPLRKRNVKKTASGSTPSLAKKNTSQGLSDPNGGPHSPPWGFEPPCPPMGAPMGGCGGPHGGLWGSTALIAPDEPWQAWGLRKTPRACLRAKKVDLA